MQYTQTQAHRTYRPAQDAPPPPHTHTWPCSVTMHHQLCQSATALCHQPATAPSPCRHCRYCCCNMAATSATAAATWPPMPLLPLQHGRHCRYCRCNMAATAATAAATWTRTGPRSHHCRYCRHCRYCHYCRSRCDMDQKSPMRASATSTLAVAAAGAPLPP